MKAYMLHSWSYLYKEETGASDLIDGYLSFDLAMREMKDKVERVLTILNKDPSTTGGITSEYSLAKSPTSDNSTSPINKKEWAAEAFSANGFPSWSLTVLRKIEYSYKPNPYEARNDIYLKLVLTEVELRGSPLEALANVLE